MSRTNIWPISWKKDRTPLIWCSIRLYKPVNDWLEMLTLLDIYCTEYVRVFPIGHKYHEKK